MQALHRQVQIGLALAVAMAVAMAHTQAQAQTQGMALPFIGEKSQPMAFSYSILRPGKWDTARYPIPMQNNPHAESQGFTDNNNNNYNNQYQHQHQNHAEDSYTHTVLAERQRHYFFPSSPTFPGPSFRDSNALPTEPVDQTLVSPPAKNPMELAGWWEYLALLFGDAGDERILRVLLQRLTRLAQTQLGDTEAGKVMGATAMLQQRFAPLFSQRITQPAPPAQSIWDNDARYVAIVTELLERADLSRAKDEWHELVDANPAVTGSDQLQRLQLVLMQIDWDRRYKDQALIPLWSESWGLANAQKLDVLRYAESVSRGVLGPLQGPSMGMPHRDQVMARVASVVSGDLPSAEVENDPTNTRLDKAYWYFAKRLSTGTLCQSEWAKEGSESTGGQSKSPSKLSTSASSTSASASSASSASASPTSAEHQGLKSRVDDYCKATKMSPQFSQYCQVQWADGTPLSALLGYSQRLNHDQVNHVAHLERVFWAAIWANACAEASRALNTLNGQLAVIQRTRGRAPGNARLNRALLARFQYMQQLARDCVSSSRGHEHVGGVLSLLLWEHPTEAFVDWEQRFAGVAASLEGYAPPSAHTVDAQLMHQEARAARLALLLYRYPRAVYCPCLGRGLLAHAPEHDLTLLNLALSLEARAAMAPAMRRVQSATAAELDAVGSSHPLRTMYLKALFIAGRYLDAARVASDLLGIMDAGTPANGERLALVRAILACTRLCGAESKNPCAAVALYEKLQGSVDARAPAQGAHVQAYAAGLGLARASCAMTAQSAAPELLSLLYRKVLATDHVFRALNRQAPAGTATGRTRHSLVPFQDPWVNVLPVAPAAKILAFAPRVDAVSPAAVVIEGMGRGGGQGGGQGGGIDSDNSTDKSTNTFVYQKIPSSVNLFAKRSELQDKFIIKDGIYTIPTKEKTITTETTTTTTTPTETDELNETSTGPSNETSEEQA